jgi:predicted SnoaL-like aldol condensation-catalyzing enzyme
VVDLGPARGVKIVHWMVDAPLILVHHTLSVVDLGPARGVKIVHWMVDVPLILVHRHFLWYQGL